RPCRLMNTRRFGGVRWIVLLLLIGYVLGTLLLHKRGNDFAGSLVVAFGPARYRAGVRSLSIAAAAIILPLVVRSVWKDPKRLRHFLLLLPVVLIIDQTMMSVPLERIHYVQYGFLTWLCYKAVGRPFPAALLAFLIGYVDEANQFWVLYSGDPIQYFDWNDIALNLVGVLAALILFLPRQPLRRFDGKRVLAAIATWVAAVLLLVSFYKPDRYLFRDDPYKGST